MNTRRLASRIAARRRLAEVESSGSTSNGHWMASRPCDRRMKRSISSTARREATSPAEWPPIPSATTNSCSDWSQMRLSSLLARTSPLLETAKASTMDVTPNAGRWRQPSPRRFCSLVARALLRLLVEVAAGTEGFLGLDEVLHLALELELLLSRRRWWRRLIRRDPNLPVVLEAGAGRDEPAHRHVLLQPAQEVHAARDGRFG